MKLPTISLCLIAKNEEKNIRKCIEPLIPFMDEVILVDTGSTDKTVEIAKELGCRVEHREWIDNFSDARNYSFSFAKSEWILWIDLDDIVPDAHLIKPTLETVLSKNPNCNCVVFPYIYARDPYGNPAITLVRERLLKNTKNWFWEGRIHEYLAYPPESQVIVDESITIVHEHAQDAGNRIPRRNLDILEKELAEVGFDGASSRLLAYVGEERRAVGEVDGALDAWQKYLAKTEWVEEKYQVLCKMALLVRDKKQNIEQHLILLSNAWLTKPDWPDAYAQLAAHFLVSREFEKAIYFANETLSKGVPKTVLILNPLDYTFTPHVIKARAYAALNNLEEAIKSLTDALNIRPVEELKREINDYYQILQNAKARESVIGLLNYVKPENILNFIYALPEGMRSIPEIQDSLYRATVKSSDKDKKIAIFTGGALESWDYTNIDKQGIGGSETAAAYVAKHFVENGYDVTIFGNPPEVNQIDGVLYTPARHFNPIEPRKLVISSRVPEIFNDVQNADNKWLWLHDINMGDRMKMIPGLGNKVDKFLFISNYQKEYYFNLYPGIIPEEKVMMIRNGIDWDKLSSVIENSDIKKDRLRITWSSSPDRGLDTLLEMFPKIRESFPKASLHIFYGWDNIDKVIPQNPGLGQFKEHIMRLCRQPRVFWRGRVGQEKLYQEMMKSGVWCTGLNGFSETYGIGAIEAMACGSNPIVANVGALQETIPDGFGYKIDGSFKYDETKQAWIDAYAKVQEMSAEDCIIQHTNYIDYVSELTWESLVDQMIGELK